MGDCSPSKSKLALCCWCPCMGGTLPVRRWLGHLVIHVWGTTCCVAGFSHSAVFTCSGYLLSPEWCVSDYSMAVLFWCSISCVVSPDACKWKYSGTHPAVCTGRVRLLGCPCRSRCPHKSLVRTSSDLVLWSALHSTLTLRAPVSFRG